LQAEAGLALRRTRRSDAGQKMSEAAAQLGTLFSGYTADTNIVLRAVEEPQLREVDLDYYEAYRQAYEHNPDYLSRKSQAIAENVRLAFAKNQRLPQLDLKGSYGLNGLGQSVGNSHDDLERAEFPAWSVGVEMRIPITGGIRERNEYKAAQLSKQKSLVSLKEIEVQIGNALNTAMMKVRNLRDSVENHRSVISFHQQLLQNQLARLEVGVIDSRTVLETEEKLFEARVAALESLVQYQKALLELELIRGTTLVSRNVDLTKRELQEVTERLLAANRFSGPEIDAIRQEVNEEYKRRIKDLDAPEKQRGMVKSIFE
jgi:outer membrane protein TolC